MTEERETVRDLLRRYAAVVPKLRREAADAMDRALR
jgi:hypothetical protein